MPVEYITTDSSLAVPDESEWPLHSYHSVVEQRIGEADLIGLAGLENGIRRIVVSEELSGSAQSDLEDYLKAEIELVDDN